MANNRSVSRETNESIASWTRENADGRELDGMPPLLLTTLVLLALCDRVGDMEGDRALHVLKQRYSRVLGRYMSEPKQHALLDEDELADGTYKTT